MDHKDVDLFGSRRFFAVTLFFAIVGATLMTSFAFGTYRLVAGSPKAESVPSAIRDVICPMARR